MHFTCDEVQAATGKCFREESEDSYSDEFENTCSALTSFYRTGGRLCGKTKFRNKLHVLSYELRLFHFDTLHGSKDRDVDALLSEHVSHNDLVDNSFILHSQNIPWEI